MGYLERGTIFFSKFGKFMWSIISRWVSLVVLVGYSLLHIIVNPSFLFYMVIALGLSTMGLWIDFFPPRHIPGGEIALSGLSVFTFSIATLGSMATAYVFEVRSEAPLMDGYGYPNWLILIFQENTGLLKHSIIFL